MSSKWKDIPPKWGENTGSNPVVLSLDSHPNLVFTICFDAHSLRKKNSLLLPKIASCFYIRNKRIATLLNRTVCKGWGNFCHSITSDRSKYGRIKNGLTCPHGIVKNNSATPCDFTNNLLRRVADTERSVSLKRRKEEGPRNGDVRQTSER